MFQHLKSALGKRLAELNLKGFADASEVCAVANRLLATNIPALGPRAHARHLKNGVLTIAVTSSMISQEIELQKTKIIGELKKQFPSVKRLRYETNRQQNAE